METKHAISQRLECSRRTRGTRRHGHAFQIEIYQQSLAFDKTKRDVRKVAQAAVSISVHHDIRNHRAHFGFEAVAQSAAVSSSLRHLFASKLRCLAKGDDPRNVLCACAAFAFLVSANVLLV